jgi:sulfide:quinone oxidoreductase
MKGKLEVAIAGAGVAGLEAAFALQALAADHVNVTLVDPGPDFVYRPMAVREPFTRIPAQRYSLASVAADAGAELLVDAFRWLDAANRVLHTRGGREVAYDALVLALGARPRSPFRHATTIDAHGLGEQITRLLAGIDRGQVKGVVGVIPSTSGWPLPMYELLLMIARRARDIGAQVELTLVTCEETPLGVFGAAVSEAVSELLSTAEITVITGAVCEVPARGVVSLRPGTNTLEADRVLSMPLLYGPSTPGLPKRARDGFIEVDAHCRVRGVQAVFAAGDATDFPLKFGAVASEQADTAARAIARAAGADVRATPFHPVVHGMLLSGGQPLYMSVHLVGDYARRSEVSAAPTWRLPTKLAARYLAPYLDARDRATAR